MKIMFVCHGNICRSPMAEFIFKDLAERRGVGDLYEVCSRATSREEIWNGIGNPVYPPAKEELSKHCLSCAGKRAEQVEKADYDQFDLFVVMDENNVRNIMRIFEGDPQHKVHKLMSFTNQPGDVADPWYSGDFSTTYRDILLGCEGLLKKLTEN